MLPSAYAAASFHGPECWADWLRGEKVLSRKMGVLGDVHEIAVAKLNNGYSRTVATRHCFRSKGIGAERDARTM